MTIIRLNGATCIIQQALIIHIKKEEEKKLSHIKQLESIRLSLKRQRETTIAKELNFNKDLICLMLHLICYTV